MSRLATRTLVLGALVALLTGLLAGAGTTGPPAASASTTTPAGLASAARPLVVVLDVSSSMSEDDGAGTIKLAGAQSALTEVIRQQRPGATIGLWTYPSSGNDCGAGRFAVPADEVDQRSMIATVRGLGAHGDTPTGQALRKVADELTAQGYEGATLLLISDGQSNCGSRPCATARQIVREGFDLTVQAAGFQISGAGLRELECIAGATGGQAFDVKDSDQLQDVIEEAGRAELTMEVSGIPTRTPAGSASRVSVTVTNDSAVDVQDARISVSFANGGFDGKGVVPAALPPLVRVGNLQAGETTTEEWVVSYGSRGKTGTAGWRISAWGTNAQPVVQEGQVDVVDANLSLTDGGQQLAALSGKTVAILGDSFSSGEGGGDYDPATDIAGGNTCHRSPNTYLYPLFDAKHVVLLACSGATTAERFNKKGVNGLLEDQKPQLYERAANRPVDAAFLTIGGNDIGFADIILGCVVGHPGVSPEVPQLRHLIGFWGLSSYIAESSWDDRCSDDTEFTTKHEELIDGLPAQLIETYEQVSEALNSEAARDQRGGEVAPLYVLAYPQVFPEAQFASFCQFFDRYEIDWANQLVDRLNSRIEDAVEKAQADGWRVQMVTNTQESFLPDNTACPRPASLAFMNSLQLNPDMIGAVASDKVLGDSRRQQEFMHPNRLGYQAETNSLLAWSVQNDGSLEEPAGGWRTSRSLSTLNHVAESWVSDLLRIPLPASGPAVFDAAADTWLNEPVDARGGVPLRIEVVNAAPGTQVTIMIQSRARTLGFVEVGEDGRGSGQVLLPRKLPPGTHQLTALGLDESFGPAVATQAIDVARAVPEWLTLVLVATILLVLGWAVSTIVDRRRRRGPREIEEPTGPVAAE